MFFRSTRRPPLECSEMIVQSNEPNSLSALSDRERWLNIWKWSHSLSSTTCGEAVRQQPQYHDETIFSLEVIYQGAIHLYQCDFSFGWKMSWFPLWLSCTNLCRTSFGSHGWTFLVRTESIPAEYEALRKWKQTGKHTMDKVPWMSAHCFIDYIRACRINFRLNKFRRWAAIESFMKLWEHQKCLGIREYDSTAGNYHTNER